MIDWSKAEREGNEMSVLSTTTRTRVGVKTAKQAAKHPKLAVRGARTVAPVVRGRVKLATRLRGRQVQRQTATILATGRQIGQAAFALGRQAAQNAAEKQVHRKRTVPRVAVGIAIGAAGMYFLDPASGEERRRGVSGLIGSNSSRQDDPADHDNEAGGSAHPAPGHLPPDSRRG
jgi:hypothetical protein